MNQNTLISNKQFDFDENEDTEIDIIEIIKNIFKNYILILPFPIIFLLFGVNNTFKQKDIWQGKFQIVLESQEKEDKSNSIEQLEGLDITRLSAFISVPPTSDLQTQVEILKSQSVLMPAFNLVKEIKFQSGENTDSLRFMDWINSALKIDLESGTSVLKVNYFDTDKENIIPVLNKISDIYQNYPVKKSKQSVSRTITFLKEQIEILEEKSEKSINNFQEFSLKNNLTFPALDDSKKENFMDYANSQNNFLFLINPNNNSRSREITSKFRQLYREALRNSVSLENLEKELHILSIEQEKYQTPWKLISEPSVLEKPVGPSRTLMISQKLMYGILVGLLISLIRNLIRNAIFSEIKIKKIFNTRILEILSPKELKSWDEPFRLIKNYPLNDPKESTAIIYIGNIKEKYLDRINQLINIDKNSNITLLTRDIITAKQYTNKILLFQKGHISANKLIKFSNRLFNQGIILNGLILLDDDEMIDFDFLLFILNKYILKKIQI